MIASTRRRPAFAVLREVLPDPLFLAVAGAFFVCGATTVGLTVVHPSCQPRTTTASRGHRRRADGRDGRARHLGHDRPVGLTDRYPARRLLVIYYAGRGPAADPPCGPQFQGRRADGLHHLLRPRLDRDGAADGRTDHRPLRPRDRARRLRVGVHRAPARRCRGRLGGGRGARPAGTYDGVFYVSGALCIGAALVLLAVAGEAHAAAERARARLTDAADWACAMMRAWPMPCSRSPATATPRSFTIAAPPLNLLTAELTEQLDEAIAQPRLPGRVRAVRARRGRAAASTSSSSLAAAPRVATTCGCACLLHPAVDRGAAVPVGSLSAHGPCLTWGLELALGCDPLIASPKARSGLVEKVGLTPSMGGTQRLGRARPGERARQGVRAQRRALRREELHEGVVTHLVTPEEPLRPRRWS